MRASRDARPNTALQAAGLLRPIPRGYGFTDAGERLLSDLGGVVQTAGLTLTAGAGRDRKSLAHVSLFRGAETLVHLAWLIQPSHDEQALWRVNVEGSARTFAAAAEAGVRTLIYASSVGAYSPGPKDRLVDESWPVGGVATSVYSRHKAEVERRLDDFETEHPDLRVVRQEARARR